MRSWGFLVSCITSLALVVPSAAFAQGERAWTLSFDVGSEGNVAGDLITGATGKLSGLDSTVSPQSYKDFYDRGLYWGVGIGYNIATTGELRVRATYSKWSANAGSSIGSVGSAPLTASFDDYQTFGIDGGFRVYFTSWESRVRPFVGSSVGFVRIKEIRGTVSASGAGVSLPNIGFWNATTSPTFGAEAGLQVTVGPNVAIQGGLDFKWHSDLDDEDGLSGTGLEGLNDDTAQWRLPIFAGLTIRF